MASRKGGKSYFFGASAQNPLYQRLFLGILRLIHPYCDSVRRTYQKTLRKAKKKSLPAHRG